MSNEDKEISIIDLIEYYEPGPVLKQRTPDLNRVSFHPGDGEHHDGEDAASAGKNITSSTRRRWLSKKALGLTDIPIHGTPGNTGAFRQRDEYSEEDFEAQFATGFGGPSELDNFLEKEDKSPTNISRKLNTDKKLKTLGDLDKMSFQKSELLKLAKALRFRGHNNFADSISKLAGEERTPDERLFLQVYEKSGAKDPSIAEQVRINKNKAFVDSTYGELSLGTGLGTREGLMLRSLLAKPDIKSVKDMFAMTSMSASYGTGKKYADMPIMEIVRSELSGDYLVAAEMIIRGSINLQNFDPEKGAFIEEQPSESPARPSEGGVTPKADEGTVTTQMRTVKDVQRAINRVYEVTLRSTKVEDGVIKGKTDSNGRPIDIPIEVDGALGPQTTASYNEALVTSYQPYEWPITTDKAYENLQFLIDNFKPQEEETVTSQRPDTEGEAEPVAEVDTGDGEGAIVSGDGRVKYMTREEFGADYWIAQSPQYRGQIVGVGKSGTGVSGDIVFMDGRFSETTYNGEKLVRPSEAHALVMPVDAREGRNFPGQPQTLTAREKRKLLAAIKPNVEKEELKSFRRILGGSIQEGRTGGATSRRSRARGQRRQDRGRAEIR